MSCRPACSDRIDPGAAEVTRFGLTSQRASVAIFLWADGFIAVADSELEGRRKQLFDQNAAQMVNHLAKVMNLPLPYFRLMRPAATHFALH